MKILLLLVVLANIGLLMWEYKQGAFEPAVDLAGQYASSDREPILLVSELKVRQAQAVEPKQNIVAGLEQALATETAPVFPEGLEIQGNPLLTEQLTPPAMKHLTIKTDRPDQNSAVLVVVETKSETVATGPARDGQPTPESKPAQLMSAAVEKIQNSDNTKEPTSCYEAGPFANGNAYQLWKKELNVAGKAIQPSSRNGEVISDYLVYYPAPETLQQAEANLKLLRDKGVNDLWLFRKGQDKGMISLGIFKNESRALAMKSQLLAKDIKVEVKPRYTIKPQKYARIKGRGKVLERLNVMKQTYPAIAVKPINPCW